MVLFCTCLFRIHRVCEGIELQLLENRANMAITVQINFQVTCVSPSPNYILAAHQHDLFLYVKLVAQDGEIVIDLALLEREVELLKRGLNFSGS